MRRYLLPFFFQHASNYSTFFIHLLSFFNCSQLSSTVFDLIVSGAFYNPWQLDHPYPYPTGHTHIRPSLTTTYCLVSFSLLTRFRDLLSFSSYFFFLPFPIFSITLSPSQPFQSFSNILDHHTHLSSTLLRPTYISILYEFQLPALPPKPHCSCFYSSFSVALWR